MRAFLLALALAASASAAPRERRLEFLKVPLSTGPAVMVAAEEALIRLADADLPGVKASLAAVGAQVESPVGSTGWYLVYLPPGMPVPAGLTLLQGLPGVKKAAANRLYRPTVVPVVPNDPQVGSQYHLTNLYAFAAWGLETGVAPSPEVVVAVMDTGIQGTHPDLSGKLVANRSVDCSSGVCGVEQPPVGVCNHGTRVAGLAAASTNDSVGIAGMSWGARLVSLRVFPGACNAQCSNFPACSATDASIVAALDYVNTVLRPALGHPRIVVNMSLGAPGACKLVAQGGALDEDFQAYINAGHGNGISYVAATGNDGANAVDNPANCDHVIPVGATDQNNGIASFSNRGPELAARGLVAPGVNVVTTDVGSGYTSAATGTSFASPIVAGLAALMRSANPVLTPDGVIAGLRASASHIGQSVHGAGITPLAEAGGAGVANAYRATNVAKTGSTGILEEDKASAFPNPFKPSTHGQVEIRVPRSLVGHLSLKIYTLAGQHVTTISGTRWNGKNSEGRPVATGTYVFFLKTDTGSAVGRFSLIR